MITDETTDLNEQLLDIKDEVDEIKKQLDEVSKELDKQGAPPSMSLPERVRGMGKELRAVKEALAKAPTATEVLIPTRERLPDEREAKTLCLTIGGHKCYLTYGVYPDGRLGELFLKMAKEGSTVSGFADALAMAVSVGLQYRIPLKVYCDKMIALGFDPCGVVTGTEIVKTARSVPDLMFRCLAAKFLDEKIDAVETFDEGLGK